MTNLHISAFDPAAPAATPAAPTLRYAKRAVIGVIALLAIGAGARALINWKSAEALAQTTRAGLQRTVITTRATPGALTRTVTLPTTLRGNNETSIYARSNGYLSAWHKGIGDHVRQGELLATIAAPEQEQELAQARATRQQIQARADLSRLTLQRYESLRLRDGIAQHELEEKRSEALQAQADLAAADANVKRLEQLQGFRRIVAPFAGVIVRRGVEVGDLVSAGGKELFALTQTDPLRLSIWVPQLYAAQVEAGAPVAIELNGQRSVASVERIAGGIDTQTRSRQVDLILPNPDAKLLPGAYAEARIELRSGAEALVAPASVLMSTAEGFRVAVVDQNHQVAFRAVKLGRDLGREIELIDGITADDLLIVSPSDLLVEGEAVKTLAWEGKTGANDKQKRAQEKPAQADDAKKQPAAVTKS